MQVDSRNGARGDVLSPRKIDHLRNTGKNIMKGGNGEEARGEAKKYKQYSLNTKSGAQNSRKPVHSGDYTGDPASEAKMHLVPCRW